MVCGAPWVAVAGVCGPLRRASGNTPRERAGSVTGRGGAVPAGLGKKYFLSQIFFGVNHGRGLWNGGMDVIFLFVFFYIVRVYVWLCVCVSVAIYTFERCVCARVFWCSIVLGFCALGLF